MFLLSLVMRGKKLLSQDLRIQGKKGDLDKILKGRSGAKYIKEGWLVPSCQLWFYSILYPVISVLI